MIDGDTIELHGKRIRIDGVDAPESGQTCWDRATRKTFGCGRDAAIFLDAFLRDAVVSCAVRKRDRYGRLVAECTAHGMDVGSVLVMAGFALDYRRYSLRYLQDEAWAERYGVGMWRSEFMEPWEWRKALRGR